MKKFLRSTLLNFLFTLLEDGYRTRLKGDMLTKI